MGGTPDIRFKGFTDAWEQRKLGDSCKLNGRIGFRGYTEKDIVSKEAGGVLTFSPTNIVDNKLTMECRNTYITREKYDESPEIQISNGDILFVKTGSTLGKSALVTGLKEDASINPQIVVIRVEKGTETFMSNILVTDGVMKQVAAVKIGGAVPTMTETELKNFVYFAPTEKDEQQKIGAYFSNLDHLITLHQRKCDETKTLKKYMLQKMFPQKGELIPEIRFAGFTDAWEQRKLGEIITEYKETVDSDCTLPILTSSKTEGVILQEEHFGRKQQHDITGYNILPRNYCTYRNRSDGVDFTFNINKCCDKGIISKFYPVFSGNNSDVFFLSLVLNNSEEVVREIAYTCTGTGQKVLSFLDLQKMKVRVPSFDEQKKIAAYFDSLDHLITLHQRKCDELVEFKKYMLQNMFPNKES